MLLGKRLHFIVTFLQLRVKLAKLLQIEIHLRNKVAVMRAVKTKPPEIIFFARIRDVTDTMLPIVLLAVAGECDSAVSREIAAVLFVERMLLSNSNISTQRAHRATYN